MANEEQFQMPTNVKRTEDVAPDLGVTARTRESRVTSSNEAQPPVHTKIDNRMNRIGGQAFGIWNASIIYQNHIPGRSVEGEPHI
jgi:hypothetical protein